jgi:membrane-associated protease RseP (regulator of RpoE activity)
MSISAIISALPAIAVLALLIFVHELGHFLAARFQGIYANRFSIGFGPILWKYQGPETEYALRAIPLGGFVGFPDDDPDCDIPPEDPNLLRNRPLLDRAIVISAGVIANLLFAYLVLVVQLGVVGVPAGINYQPGVVVPQVLSRDSAAALAGIKDGDIVLAINGQALEASEKATLSLRQAIESHPNQPLELTIQRDDKTLKTHVTPKPNPDGKGKIGVQLIPNGKPIYKHPDNVFSILGEAADRFQRIVNLTLQGFGQLISNFAKVADQVAGPVGIVAIGAKIAQTDPFNLFDFAALISVNLALINILPLPALDGGHLAFLLIERVRGKPLPTNVQDGVMQTGLMLLLGLGIFLIIRDTARFFPQ